MIVANRAFDLRVGERYRPGEEIPGKTWDSLRPRTRTVLLANRYVMQREPTASPSGKPNKREG